MRAVVGSGRPFAVAVVAVLALSLASAVVTGCQSTQVAPQPTPSASPTPDPVTLTLGVYGPKEEIAGFKQVVATYNAITEGSTASLVTWANREEMRADLESGKTVPDVFLAPRGDLGWLQADQLIRPVDDLLDERGVDFGDGYARDSLQAFSAADRLQCLPYGISPMVIYYNKDLVRFDAMLARGLDVPDLSALDAEDPPGERRWTFDQFATVADFATRPSRSARGLYIEPTLRGLAPFIYSGGGELFDDEVAPTSLAFSDDATRGALERALVLLRDSRLSLTENQIVRATPLEWFKRGRVAMVAGFRSAVPELREVPGLDFDVMPMPVLDTPATVGDMTGLCLSTRADAAAAADLLVYVGSAESVATVTQAGYLQPANVAVALSDDFRQPGLLPAHAEVFTDSVRSIHLGPLLQSWPDLEDAVASPLREMLRGSVLLDLVGLTEQIDEASRTVLAPEPTPGASVSVTP